jgi:hypothetical protein
MVLIPSTCSRVRLRILYLIKSDISRQVNGLVPLHLLQGEIEGAAHLLQTTMAGPSQGLKGRDSAWHTSCNRK